MKKEIGFVKKLDHRWLGGWSVLDKSYLKKVILENFVIYTEERLFCGRF